MKITKILILLVFLISLINIGSCIHGGEKIKFTKYTKDYWYQVSIRINNVHMCGGCIIDEKFILTAGHCVMSPENKPLNNINILAGVNNLKNALNGQILAVEKIIPHERFNSKIIPYKNDIALIKLKKSIILPSQDELKISLPDNNCVSSNSGLRMCGWGKTKSCHSDEPPSNNLNCLTMFFINNNDCRNIYKLQFHDKQMCVTGGSGRGICFGDSGGPLVDADNKIVGIASGFYGGEFQRPDIFTKVCDYVSWIEDNKLQYNSL